jgi:hypothetical protein
LGRYECSPRLSFEQTEETQSISQDCLNIFERLTEKENLFLSRQQKKILKVSPKSMLVFNAKGKYRKAKFLCLLLFLGDQTLSSRDCLPLFFSNFKFSETFLTL